MVGPGFGASDGYDLATGWGSPRCGLINQLASSSPVPPLDVAVGRDHACALRNDNSNGSGSVWCWGGNESGQLGNGTTNAFPPNYTCTPSDAGTCDLPPPPPNLPAPVIGLPGPAAAIGATWGGSCAVVISSGGTVSAGGTVWCWGVGSGSGGTPSAVSGISTAVAVASGAASCALLIDGTVQCWGDNISGGLGNGSPTLTFTSTPVQTGITNAIAIRSGGNTTCALLATGAVSCWGDNTLGQLGNGGQTGFVDLDAGATQVNSTIPVPVSGITNAVDIAVGDSSACAVLSGGTAACWGFNYYGELGNNGSTINNNCSTIYPCSSTPVPVAQLTNVVEIATAVTSTCAVLGDGTVACWGANNSYQLGTGNTDQTLEDLQPEPVSALQNALFSAPLVNNGQPPPVLPYQFISGGGGNGFYCAAVKNGVLCWGEDVSGELGDGGNIDRNIPTPVRFIQIP